MKKATGRKSRQIVRTRRSAEADLAREWVLPAFAPQQIRDIVRIGRDFHQFFSRLPALKADLSVPRPTTRDIEAAVREGLRDALQSASRSGLHPPPGAQVEALVPELTRELEKVVLSPGVDGELVLRNLAQVPLLVRVEGRNALILADNSVGGMLFAMRGAGDVVVEVVLVIDFVAEILGLIAGVAGLSLPKVDAKALSGTLLEAMKKEGVREALKKLVKAALDRDPLAIIQALILLRSSGVLAEIFSGYRAQLGFWDYVKLFAKFIAFLLMALGTAGGGVLVKIGQVLLNIVELVSKGQQMQKIFSTG